MAATMCASKTTTPPHPLCAVAKVARLRAAVAELVEIIDGDDSKHVNCPFCHDGYTRDDGKNHHERGCIVGKMTRLLAKFGPN
jgi:hypothetical protein